MPGRKKSGSDFNTWLKFAIEQIDAKVDAGFEKIDKHFERLNSSVEKNQIAIAHLTSWQKYHESMHSNSSRKFRFYAKLFLGGGGVVGLICLLLSIFGEI